MRYDLQEVQMDGQQSREALIRFLDYLTEKGLIERNTAQGRKLAASKILGILEENEAGDVTEIDVEDVVARFGRLHGREYTPGSLNTYKSRLQSALDDFRSYLNNPLAFKPGIKARIKRTKTGKEAGTDAETVERRLETPRAGPIAAAPTDNILPIPIREDLTIRIQGLPYDLTEAEAQKIAAVVTEIGRASCREAVGSG